MQDLQKKHLQPKEDVYDKSKAVPLKASTKNQEKEQQESENSQ